MLKYLPGEGNAGSKGDTASSGMRFPGLTWTGLLGIMTLDVVGLTIL